MAKSPKSNEHVQLQHLGKLYEQGLWTAAVAKGASLLQTEVNKGRAALRGAAVIELDETERRAGEVASGRIRPSATIGAALIEEAAKVGARAVLGDGVSLRDHVTIEREAQLMEGACVGNFSTVREGAIVGAGSFIGSCGVAVLAGVEVPPYTGVFDGSTYAEAS